MKNKCQFYGRKKNVENDLRIISKVKKTMDSHRNQGEPRKIFYRR